MQQVSRDIEECLRHVRRERLVSVALYGVVCIVDGRLAVVLPELCNVDAWVFGYTGGVQVLHGKNPIVVGSVIEAILVDCIHRQLLQHPECLIWSACLVERLLSLNESV